jgi:hypothetical protein
MRNPPSDPATPRIKMLGRRQQKFFGPMRAMAGFLWMW